ncbi:DNA-directed RNA polymerase subunit alpha, partial [candidate division WWE3 bacterium CG_4_10_14_0_2_um_filter_41_14]
LPTRVLNTLKKSGYETISDLKNAGEDGLKNIKNIGPKTVQMVLDKVNNE